MNLISAAYAADGAQAGGDLYGTLFILVLFAVVVYFLLLRPQNKRMKAHRDLVSGLDVGDEIAITGGIVGKVTKLNDEFLSLSVADGVEMKCQRHAVSVVLPKGTLKS